MIFMILLSSSSNSISSMLRIYHYHSCDFNIRDNWGLPPDGMVYPAKFDAIKAAVAEFRDSFIAGGDDKAERELFARLWPYQDADK